MIDVEREVRDALRRHEPEVPLVDPIDVPSIARRTRSRQLLNVVGAGLVTTVVVLGIASGVSAILRAGPPTPADRPAPVDPASLTPPAEAPVVVGSGTTEGWAWILSASTDGSCVAFTDPQGSETNCTIVEALVGVEGTMDVVDVRVRSPRPPAPSIVFFFGRVPSQTATVEVAVPTQEASEGELFPSPEGVDLEMGYYVRWLVGYRYPFVPDTTVRALDAEQGSVGERRYRENGAVLERPDWAEPPSFTTLETIAAGTRQALVPGKPRFQEVPLEIAIYRNEATGLLCVGEPGGLGICGPEDDPVPAWLDSIATTCSQFPSCAWPPISLVGGGTGGMPGVIVSFGWGVFSEPVTSVRSERYAFGPSGSDDEPVRDGWLEAELYELPAEYGRPFGVFIYECDDCLTGDTIGLDADGEVIGRA
jgi:hypothetical protein